jgi:ATP-dependent DNA helicase RecG
MTAADEVEHAIERVLAGTAACELESGTLDFKTVGRSLDDSLVDLAEAAACFANTSGGVIVVGVHDKAAGSSAFVDTPLDELKTQRRIYELTVPPLIVTVAPHRVGGVTLTVITVPRSPEVHAVRHKVTERVGTACVPMSPNRINAVVNDRRGIDWSALDSAVSIDETAPAAEAEVRQRLQDAPDDERRSWARLPWIDVVTRLGLVTSPGQFNNAGLILLARTPRPLLDYTHRRSRTGELTANERLPGPGLLALLRVLDYVDLRMDRTPIVLRDGTQLFVADLPEDAVRECVINAFMHRDYADPATIQVEHTPTRLAVTSPGDFVVGITSENVLTAPSRTRNPALAGAMRALRLGEAAGVGVDRMYAAMTGVGHRPPTFVTDGVRVTVTLDGGAPNTWVTKFVQSLPEANRRDPDTLLILLSLLTRRSVTASSLAPLLQRGPEEVEVILRHLVTDEVGLLDQVRNTLTHRHGTFRLRGEAISALGPAVEYRSRAGDDTDRKVISLVRETGQVTGRLVRELLDVHPTTASRILADLVDRQVLVKTSAASRGPSVTYGMGPKFPRAKRGSRTPNTATTTRRQQEMTFDE